ncbi:MAG: hypothetical protein PHC75_03385 [Burkholderiales bacterium]|nr:hypothetical protein [Burkholderiales bacterium]
MKKLLIYSLLILPILANADNLSSGFYADNDKAITDINKGSYLVHIMTDNIESNITILSVTSREKYFSDGYGINEQGGVLINPLTLNYTSPKNYQASVGTCIVTLTQKSDNSFNIKSNDDDACFKSANVFQSTGTITSKMVNNNFYFTNNESGIKLLHGV